MLSQYGIYGIYKWLTNIYKCGLCLDGDKQTTRAVFMYSILSHPPQAAGEDCNLIASLGRLSPIASSGRLCLHGGNNLQSPEDDFGFDLDGGEEEEDDDDAPGRGSMA